MRFRNLSIWSIVLIFVLLVAACAPVAPAGQDNTGQDLTADPVSTIESTATDFPEIEETLESDIDELPEFEPTVAEGIRESTATLVPDQEIGETGSPASFLRIPSETGLIPLSRILNLNVDAVEAEGMAENVNPFGQVSSVIVDLADGAAPSIDFIIVDMVNVEEEDISEIDSTPTPGPYMDIVGTGIAMPWEAFAVGEELTEDVSSLTLSTDEMSDLRIPLTGENGTGLENAVLITQQAPNINIAVVGSQDQSFGLVYDFLVDRETGDLQYAVIVSEDTPGNNVFTVPMSQFSWQVDQSQAAAEASPGSLMANFSAESLGQAPGFESMAEFDLSSDLQDEIEDYWDSVGNDTQ